MIEVTNPTFVLLVSSGSASLIGYCTGKPDQQGRFASIDGLRGYLALFVFIQHSCIWYFYLKNGEWELPKSHLYAHIGKIGVYMFFMITGFLFFSKLIDSKTKPIDWKRLYISRIIRLAPLYLFAMMALFSIVAVKSHGVLAESVSPLLRQLIKWLGFTIFGRPDINQVPDTAGIMASVTWSLPYEWFFYGSLPVLSLLVGVVVPPVAYLFFSGLSIIGFVLWQPESTAYVAFVSGIASAILVRSALIRELAKTSMATIIIILAMSASIGFFPLERSAVPFALLSVCFGLIACGNSFFGILTRNFARILGEMSYSIYLLHGMLLYVTFEFVIGADNAAAMSAPSHWAVVLLDTPILIGLCFLTYRLIEYRPMQAASRVSAWLTYRQTPSPAARPIPSE